MKEALVFLAAYFVGSIPVGYLVARANGIDIFKTGSGNVGATNVMRSLGKKWGIVVFVLDLLKGFASAMVGGMLLPEPGYGLLVGVIAIVGHCLSPFLKFRGGKGIATGVGALFGSVPEIAGICLAAYALVFVTTRYVSVASIVAIFLAVILGYAFKLPPVGIYALWGMWALIAFRHKGNIERLLKGEEPKFYAKGARPEQPGNSVSSEDKEPIPVNKESN
ncbi:MAG: glycerol-3-phosphate 1-O-acyltransferase PlsY [Fimbriimonadaceae bacterium]|nr:glycerol-3-phosphate 1-O-acyltransferase PlsY [Fimbriimonadaceae bacterium]